MKAYAVVWSDQAKAALKKLDLPIRRRIHAKVIQASQAPERYSMRLVNSPYSRIRVGDWRVIIHIERATIRIIVIDVAHRRGAYE